MALRLSTGLRTALLSQNLVANGKFTSATTSWAGGGGAVDATLTSVASGQEGNCLKVLESGSATAGYATQTVTVRTGGLYYFECYFKLGDGTNGLITVGSTLAGTQYYTSGNVTDATWALYKGVFLATGTSAYICLYANQDGKYNYFDEVRLCPLGNFKDIFDGGSIKIYSGSQPTEADDVASGTLLVTITNASTATGVTFDDASAGVITKAAAETWSGVCAATGTAGWFRLLAPGDLATDNTTDCRLDGAVATSGSQLNMSSTSFTLGATETVSTFSVTLPAA